MKKIIEPEKGAAETVEPKQERDTGRREFLKTAAAIAGGIAVSASVSSDAQAQVRSISLSQLKSAVQEAVRSAVQKHPRFRIDPPKGISIGYFIWGIPAPESLLANVTVAETRAFANDIVAHINKAQPQVLAGAGAHGVVYSTGGHTTIGFTPAESIVLE